MSTLKENWSTKLWYERIIFVAGLLSSVAVVVLAVLQLCNICPNAAYAYLPLMAVTMLSQAYENRKRSKFVAYSSVGTAAFLLAVWALVAFIL